MTVAGIDMGIQNTKAVIMRDDKIIGRAWVPSGGIDRPAQARKAYEEALQQAGLDAEEVDKVIATGKGKYDIPFAGGRVTETMAAARAARLLYPEATAVMSVGADESLAAILGKDRLICEFVLNQKCAAGLGVFLTYLAKRLGMPLEAINAAEGPDAGVIMNEGCVVFSELDALSLINNGASQAAVLASAVKAVAVRAANVLIDLTAPVGEHVVLIGGLAKNQAFVHALEKQLGRGFMIPADADYCGAIGAAASANKPS